MLATLGELAALVEGQLVGDGGVAITGAASLGDAEPGQITLIDGDDKNHLLQKSRASAVLAPKGYVPDQLPAILVDDVHRAFAIIIVHFHPRRQAARIGVSPLASVSPSARIADGVDVHPFAAIGDDVVIESGVTIHSGVTVMAGSKIGRDTVIYPNAVLYEETVVGPRCVIHANAVLGAFGFGYGFAEGRHILSAQLGNVILGADVEIGAGSTIDRGTYGPTVIGEGTKIDDLVMVAHNCRLGRHNMLCSQVGVAGSTTTGDYVTMAGQVGVRDHVHIGSRAVLGAKAGISNDVPEGARVIGIPATPERDQKIKQAVFSKLPEMRQQLKKLQRLVEGIAARLGMGEGLSIAGDDAETKPDQRRAVA
ncbi:MAG: UDP-3-O-(3-hydroxymyristoyl)glucosamine N-acyltransferase [Pirellulales bacterium]|nr:UDP-3-O-(3-hydroxymyristoyl)glucosamine N-acyltransferase [Pirellulales bacterium]